MVVIVLQIGVSLYKLLVLLLWYVEWILYLFLLVEDRLLYQNMLLFEAPTLVYTILRVGVIGVPQTLIVILLKHILIYFTI
ncbi:hypothetical protein BDF19DRAFT_438961 [Syncephalis fuscata]|nr:hypothetical protein BDF19DRAFT_438961 [Syncephalis fuscata]